MRHASWAPAALLVIAVAAPTSARQLTEARFLEEALAAHPGIAVKEADAAAAEGHRRQAGVIDNPEFAWGREDPKLPPAQDTFLIDWKLPFDGRKHRISRGDAAVAAANADLVATRLGGRLELRAIYAEWFVAHRRETLLDDHLDRTRRLASWLRARAEEGEAAGVEARRLDLEVEVLERELATVRANARSRRAAAAVWSTTVTPDVEPHRPKLPPPPTSVDLEGHPSLMAQSHRVMEAEAEARLQRRSVQPPSVALGWTEFSADIGSTDGPVFGVSWPVPIFDRNQGNRQAAASEADAARLKLELKTRRMEQRARAALASYTDLYPTTKPSTTDDAVGNVSLAVFAAFEAGEASLTDVLDSLRASIAVRMARLDNLESALAAERELEAAIGRSILPGGTS